MTICTTISARGSTPSWNLQSDPLGAGWAIIQSKIALGLGGMWVQGYLQGTQGHLDFPAGEADRSRRAP